MTGEPFRHSPGVFSWLSTAFQTISNTFTWLGNAASKILFVRGIAPYFYTIDYWTWEAAIEFSKADTWASNTWTAIGEKMRPVIGICSSSRPRSRPLAQPSDTESTRSGQPGVSGLPNTSCQRVRSQTAYPTHSQ